MSKHVMLEESVKVLLVDDNMINQEVAVNMLKIQGYYVDVVNNGQQALDALSENIYQLVLNKFLK